MKKSYLVLYIIGCLILLIPLILAITHAFNNTIIFGNHEPGTTGNEVFFYNESIPVSVHVFTDNSSYNVSVCSYYGYNYSNASQIYFNSSELVNSNDTTIAFNFSVPSMYDKNKVSSFTFCMSCNDSNGEASAYECSRKYVYITRPNVIFNYEMYYEMASFPHYSPNIFGRDIGNIKEYNHSNLDSTINFSVYDISNISSCQVWSNFSGTYEINNTFFFASNKTSENLAYNVTLGKGYYLINTYCNNSFNQWRWSNVSTCEFLSAEDQWCASYPYPYSQNGNWSFAVADTITPDASFVNINPVEFTTYPSRNIEINFTFNEANPDTCYYKVTNYSGGGTVISDTILANNLAENTSCNGIISVPYDGIFYVWAGLNDTFYNGCTCEDELNPICTQRWCNAVQIAVTTTYPSINLNTPTTNRFFNSSSINFSATATDSDGVSTCQLWGNWSGGWSKEYTWDSITSGAPFSAIINNIPANSGFIFNVWCNDSTDVSGWTLSNRTFNTDTVLPVVTINSPTASYESSSLVILVNYNITDSNINNCYFTLKDSFGALHNYAENTSLNCALSSRYIAVLSDGTYTLYITGRDKANNEVTDSVLFSVNTAVEPSGGGGGTPTLLPSQNLTWHAYANVYAGTQKFSYLVVPGSKRSDEIIFVNEDVEDINLSITCDGPLCQYITFNTPTEFTLSVSREITTALQFTLSLPEDIDENKIYSTNIVAMDQNGMIDVITIEASVGKSFPSRIIAFFLKFGESRTIEGIKLPVIVIYLISVTIMSVIMNFVFIRQKSHVPLGILSGLLLSLITIAFL